MPPQPTVFHIRLQNIALCLTQTIKTLDELSSSFRTPFLPTISSTTLTLITAVDNIKTNKDECAQLMEKLHVVLYAILEVYLKSKPMGELSPTVLHNMGTFTETLHKIYTFVEAQQNGNKIKHLFRRSEMNTLLKSCHTGLEQATGLFQLEAGISVFTAITEMQSKTEDMHREILDTISALSNDIGSGSEKSSLIYHSGWGSQTSSNSLSMLPGKPKIFHGRDLELRNIVNQLSSSTARIAILGGGRMGKTSLARAVVHHPGVCSKYEQRFFVACDTVSNQIELAALIGSYLGLKPGKDLTKLIVQHFSTRPFCLLVLDNLETPWEPLELRSSVERFLALLTDIPQLALIITMRGAERPEKVQWTHPFLPPLQPLSYEAALQTFMDIADDDHDSTDVNELLLLTDRLPLAVDLIAHLADQEGSSNLLARWETEKTCLISDGYDKRSSLDASINMSLSSSRITSSAGAIELLKVLSILPDGLSDVQLLKIGLPIQNILDCKTTLLRTALAYTDDKRLKSLVPIREHIYRFYPLSHSLIQPLFKYFDSL
ncbi:P-loop containing nucleoside triphosphate hydrolase protein, partial [Mycena albidolilacea]